MACHHTRLTLCTLGLAAAAMLVPGTYGAAHAASAVTNELSAQGFGPNPNQDQGKGKPKSVPRKQNVQPRQNLQRKQLNIQQRQNVQQNQRKFQQNKQIRVQKKTPTFSNQKKVIVVPQGAGKQKFVGKPKTFTPRHDRNLVFKFKLNNARQALLHGKNYSVYRRDYRVRRNGRLRTFVALGLLAPLLIGANHYYPYAYLDVPEDYCEGLTEDGCELVYDEVDTVDGDAIPQCVAYCPWQ